MENITQLLKQFIIEEFLSINGKTTLENDFPLIEEGVIDSMGIFMVINFINERFGVKILPEDVIIDNFETLVSISNLVNKRIQENIPI